MFGEIEELKKNRDELMDKCDELEGEKERLIQAKESHQVPSVRVDPSLPILAISAKFPQSYS